ncbi:hypothetical protein [Leucobacter sp. GX24907]
MSIRRKFAATGTTVALVIGGVFTASPAYAMNHSWSGMWDSKATCHSQTAKKVAALKKQKVTYLKVRATCAAVGGSYYSQFSWRTK